MGIGDSIARLRRGKGWTQAELAQATGLSSGYIAAIEEGRVQPSLKTVAIIAEKLGTSIEEIREEKLSE